MKRILPALLTLILAFSFSACNDSSAVSYTPSSVASDPTSTESIATPESDITLSLPQTEKDVPDESGSGIEADSGVVVFDPAFQATMDEYESFMGVYCNFLKTFHAGEIQDNAAAEYENYIQQYNEIQDKMSAIDLSALSAEENEYYIEVTARMNDELIAANMG